MVGEKQDVTKKGCFGLNFSNIYFDFVADCGVEVEQPNLLIESINRINYTTNYTDTSELLLFAFQR